MNRLYFLTTVILLTLFTLSCNVRAATATTLPDPAVDESLAKTKGEQVAVVAGGCFWGIQAVFQHVKGVISVKSGYSGGPADQAHYEMVSTGATGHAESVRIVFDPSQVSYGQLLKVFFAVAHDPTQLNRQGPDRGTQYRSAIFYANGEQKRIALAYVEQLNAAKVFSGQIATQVAALDAFYQAEDYHQDYATRHPDEPYIYVNDLPKVDNLRKELPGLYVKKER